MVDGALTNRGNFFMSLHQSMRHLMSLPFATTPHLGPSVSWHGDLGMGQILEPDQSMYLDLPGRSSSNILRPSQECYKQQGAKSSERLCFNRRICCGIIPFRPIIPLPREMTLAMQYQVYTVDSNHNNQRPPFHTDTSINLDFSRHIQKFPFRLDLNLN